MSEVKRKLVEANEKISILVLELEKTQDILKAEMQKVKDLTRRNAELERQLDPVQTTVDSENDPRPAVGQLAVSRKKKSWEDLGSSHKRAITQELYDAMDKTARERGIDTVQLAGSLLRR